MTLTAGDFGHFFQAIHGYRPFPWQQALVDRLGRDDCWPDVLDLPTGAGKTAALDTAVFHLALRVDAPGAAALRIVLVVDRRLVVDDAYARACRIVRALADPDQTPAPGRAVVEAVAGRLQSLAGEDWPPLVAARLRGGAPLEHEWARTPIQPTILCSTVDQVGSRLLFRGYGVSDRMKPVHAGLLGEDSLVLLDEAHLSEPFRQTLDEVRDIGNAGVKTVLLTATPGASGKRPFVLGPLDRADPILKGRLEASKRAKLLKPVRNDPVGAFAREAREMAARLRRDGMSSPAVGVVVNRVKLARDIFENLRKSEDRAFSVLLMIGRSRDVTRDRLVEELDPFRTDATARNEAAPLVLVATQCLEVGVDLDLDGLVTQAASFDALRQRFGRLNRAGRPIATEGAILVTSDALAKRAEDPVYGDRIRKTWDALNQIADGGYVDFGVAALDRRLQDANLAVADLAAHRAGAPTIMPAYFDLWAQTSPPPATDPDVGLFLHGAERALPDVSLAWRSDITESDMADGAGADLKAILELVPPRTAEMIDVPIWAATAWLHKSSAPYMADVADVTGQEEPAAPESSPAGRRAFRWAGSDDPRTGLAGPADLRPGDVLVVPADYGGCDEFGWAPESSDPVTDVGDAAARPFYGRRFALRIARDVVRSDSRRTRLSEIIEESDGAVPLDELLEVLLRDQGAESNDLAADNVAARDILEALRLLRDAETSKTVKGRVESHFPYANHAAGVILVAAHGLREAADSDTGQSPATEDDRLSCTSLRPVALQSHTDHVVAQVNYFARALRLPEEIAFDLNLAAFLHDIGKADSRFQTFLAGGDWWNRHDGPPLAKSGRYSRSAWERAGLPSGWRHEALSVRMAPAHPKFAQAHDPELVLWLIGTHHGLGRPFFAFSDPADCSARTEVLGCLGVDSWHLEPGKGPQSLAYDFSGLDWAAMSDGLKRRYGIWGLARLEAILRLADHRASEKETMP